MRNALFAFLCACQAYDFEPVEPSAFTHVTASKYVVARAPAPNLMLVVDRSLSMSEPVGTGGATRIGELKGAMASFTGAQTAQARVGLTVFPAEADGCGAGFVALDIPSSPAAVNAKIQELKPQGGTPTSATLRKLLSNDRLVEGSRRSFVLLLTDGLPNCNAENPADPLTCACTSAVSPCPSKAHCLDLDASTAAIAALRGKGASTIVIGFGADLKGSTAAGVLDAMATAGGFARRCSAAAECGSNDACDLATGFCGQRFYRAENAGELTAALEQIQRLIDPPEACRVVLDEPPQHDAMMAVLVDGKSVPPGPGAWSYQSGVITFDRDGATCQRILQATPENPTLIEVRVLNAIE